MCALIVRGHAAALDYPWSFFVLACHEPNSAQPILPTA